MFKFPLNLVKNDSKASGILDMLRFLAAVTVFLFHFFVPLPGYQAVMVFFVLSGYFISSTILKSITENRWKWSDYLIKRLTRLWIVLLPALFLTYIIANIQLGLFGEELSPANLKVSNFLNWDMLLGNIFFLQGVVVDGAFGLNGPLWSLTYEFWYYIIFPCIILIFHSKQKRWKLFYVVLTIIFSIFVGEKIMSYFLIWLLGAVIPLIKSLKVEKLLYKYPIVLASVALSLLSLNYTAGSGFLYDLGVGAAFAFLTYMVISFFNDQSYNLRYDFPKYLAGFSFTLYLTHYPLANLILTWRASTHWPFDGNPLIVKASLALIVFGFAWIVSLITEKHTDKVRRFVTSLKFKKETESVTNKTVSPKTQ